MDKNTRKDTLIYGVAKYSTVIMTLLTSAILARLISPEEYGVVTIVTVFTAFFTVLADMGLGTAIIQNKTLSDEEVNDIFSFSVYIALALGVLFAILGIPVAAFYGNEVYHKICPILGISVFFNAVNIVPNAVLMKAKRFRVVGMRLLCVSVAAGASAIGMAWLGFRYYAIVLQSVLQSVLVFAWNWAHVSLKFRLGFQRASIQKVWGFSAYQFLYNGINYLARNLDNLLIGKLLGGVALAYYDKGYRLMMYPVQNLTYVVNPILHPVLSEHQENRRYIYDSYLKVTHVLSLIGVFVSMVCFWGAEEIILLFFGDRWVESVPVFRLLSLSVWPQMVCSSAGAIYQSTGNTRLMFRSGAVHFTLTIVMIVAGIALGSIEIVAAFVMVSLYLRFLIDYFVLVKLNFGYSYLRFLASFRLEAGFAIVAGACIALCGFEMIDHVLLGLVLKMCIMLIMAVLMLYFTGELRSLAAVLLGKKRHKAP